MNMLQVFKLGDVIGGYCHGYFGRDGYGKKVCVMVTINYAVFEFEDGSAETLNYSEELAETYRSDGWKHIEDEDDE